MTAKTKGTIRKGTSAVPVRLDRLVSNYRVLPVDKIDAPKQFRMDMDQEALQSLADSLGREGLLSPIQVRPLKNGRYTLVSGGRRFEAATKLLKVQAIPAFVLSVNDHEALRLQLAENIHREDLNPIEMAEAIEIICRELVWLNNKGNPNVKRFARETGMKETSIREYLSLTQLPHRMQEAIAARRLPKMVGVYVASLPHHLQRDYAWNYIRCIEDVTTDQVKLFCRQIRPTMDSDTPKSGGIRLFLERLLFEALEKGPLSDEGREFLEQAKVVAAKSEAELDAKLGVPAVLPFTDAMLGAGLPAAGGRRVMPELTTLPPVPHGKTLATRLESYIELLLSEAAKQSNPEYEFAAKVLGRLYNAVLVPSPASKKESGNPHLWRGKGRTAHRLRRRLLQLKRRRRP